MSDNGTYILLGEGGGRLWYSSNGGTSFTEQKPAGDANKDWRDYIVSDDGQILFACIPGGRFYRSENAGSNWSEVQPAGNVNAGWVCIDASSDCNYVWAGCDGGRLYKSTDGGDSWSEVRPAGSNANKDWRNLTVSRDGSKVIVTNSSDNKVWFSSDYGVNWTEVKSGVRVFLTGVDGTPASGPAHLKTWNGVAIANIKTINGTPIANVKTWNGIN